MITYAHKQKYNTNTINYLLINK